MVILCHKFEGHKKASAEKPGNEATKEGVTRPAECPKHETEEEAPTYEPLKYSAESRGIRKDALIELLDHAIETLEKSKGIWFYFSIEMKERSER